MKTTRDTVDCTDRSAVTVGWNHRQQTQQEDSRNAEEMIEDQHDGKMIQDQRKSSNEHENKYRYEHENQCRCDYETQYP